MRIKHRQMDWPENLPDVRDIGHERVLDAPGEWQLSNRLIRMDLQNERDRGTRDRQGSKRQFFYDKRFALTSSLLAPCSLPSSERPVIQEKQNYRGGHQHRFRHQSAGKQDEHGRVAPERRRAHIANVGDEGQKKE